MRYWGGYGIVRKLRKTGPLRKSHKPGSTRLTSLQEELSLVLMKLRMVINTELLLDVFGISSAHVSQIINTWVKMLTATLCSLIFLLSKQMILQYLSKDLKDY